MYFAQDQAVYEAVPSPAGLTIRRYGGEREVFIPWSRVLENSFPVDPGEHAEQILEGRLTVPQYLALDDEATLESA